MMLRRAVLLAAACSAGPQEASEAQGGLCFLRRRDLARLVAEAAPLAEEWGLAGVLGFLCCFVAATLVMIPTGPLEMAAGLLFSKSYGLTGAMLLAAAAKQLSGSIGFFLGRTLLREWVQETVISRFPVFKAVMQAVETEPFTVTCMVRFAPIPTTAKSMGLAASGVAFGPFLAASALFGAPWSALSAAVGSSLASLPELLEGRGEEKLRAIIASWKEQPLYVGTCALLAVLAVAFLALRTRKMLATYRELMQKAA
ncbi:unnamed protein product [Effrenium voratum]|uniref:VTT domain-containing protein n=1 Tax=Effrenium voratum TaxID=2562239 RepID=A0AA36NEF3_9DINO|nr:unnamed protein product [Effrenium voratum]CAJ1417372.1 unnamed protein product [Effrenium voratum]